MPLFKPANLVQDEDRYLLDSHYGVRFARAKDDGKSPFFLDGGGLLYEAFLQAAQVAFAFVLALVACATPIWALCIVCVIASVCMLAWKCAVLAVLTHSVIAGKYHKPVFRKTLLFWSYWPVVSAVLCFVAAALGIALGVYIWRSCLHEYYELSKLQRYQDIDPQIVPGAQLQDAGIVEFTRGADVDHSRGGCFVGAGHTYCVAPIVHGGEVLPGLGASPRTGSYDYFAVGIDCCTCPNQDFRCGNWLNPYAHSGTRSTDFRSRPFYRLAVDDWAASYRKVSEHPLFFEWQGDAFEYWNGLRGWSFSVAFFCCTIALPVALTITLFLAKVLQALVVYGFVSPLDTPAPPAGHERAWRLFLPEMLRFAEEEMRQLLSIPITAAPWYAPMPNFRPAAAAPAAPTAAPAAASQLSYGLLSPVLGPPVIVS